MKTINILICFFMSLSSFSQDTILVKKQKGLLFLTNYNYQYDWDSSEIKPLGFDDFFFPVESFNTKLMSDSNINFSFKNGIRIEFIKNRLPLKRKALSLECIDTSRCYEYDKFYIIPVEMDYKVFNYNFENCRRNFYQLQVKDGSNLRFEYRHMAMLPIKITTLPPLETKKYKTNKATH